MSSDTPPDGSDDVAAPAGVDPEWFQQDYDTLRSFASRVKRHRGSPSFQTTSILHRAFEKALTTGSPPRDRSHRDGWFWKVLDRVVLSLFEKETAQKRGGRDRPMSFDAAIAAGLEPSTAILETPIDVHLCLEELRRHEPREAEVFELREVKRLSVNETAEALGVSPSTVKRDHRKATIVLRACLTAQRNTP